MSAAEPAADAGPAGVAARPATLSDYIMVFAAALEPDRCRRLIERFEASPEVELRQRLNGYSLSQLDVTKAWPDEQEALRRVFIGHFNRYRREQDIGFWTPNFALEHIQLKRYLPGGRDQFLPHVDTVDQLSGRRFMTAMIYLNDTDGGETAFPTLDVRIAPQTGKLLAFPPLWLFPHAGLPPLTTPKYILHTYLCYAA
jgi:hypothetical protein